MWVFGVFFLYYFWLVLFFGGMFLMKNYCTCTYWIWDDHSQLSTTPLIDVGHIQCVLEQLLTISMHLAVYSQNWYMKKLIWYENWQLTYWNANFHSQIQNIFPLVIFKFSIVSWMQISSKAQNIVYHAIQKFSFA